LVLTVLWLGIVVRLVLVQIVRWRYYERRAAILHYDTLELVPPRGRIFDRFGRAIALNRSCCSIRILPQYVRDKDTLAEILADFGLGERSEIRKQLDEHKRLFWFKRKVAYAVADSLREVLVDRRFRNCTLVDEDNLRVYPYGEVCANIIGFMGYERGLAGLETELDSVLRGRPGWVMLQRDAAGHSYPYPSYPVLRAVPGVDVHLTLDLDIQTIAFQTLRAGVVRTQALKGAVIVLDCRTGAILALVDYPTYDPARFLDFNPERYKSSAVSDQFEPGSSFKVVTCAAALESPNMAELTSRTYDVTAGYVEIQGKKIHDVHRNGVLSFDSVFINSSNAACALIATSIEPEFFYHIAQGLGFANPVAIGLPNEGTGSFDPPRKLSPLRLANNAFGQGVTVTLIQMAAAYLCVANDGVYLRPFLIESVRSRGRVLVRFGKTPIRRVLKPEMAQRIKNILTRVVTHGTGVQAAIPGVTVAGKTGTAQKVEANGRYSKTKSVMTFVGFFPIVPEDGHSPIVSEDGHASIQRPKYLIAVMLDEPKTDRFAGTAACPIFKEIGTRILELERMRKNPDPLEQRAESRDQKPETSNFE